jgi:tetratricopeptide (TPR) repeat protein
LASAPDCAPARWSGSPTCACQGRLEEAEQLLDGIDVDADVDAARPLAAILLARGQTALAGDVLERALDQVGLPSTAAAPLLALLVDVHLAANRIDQAEAAAEQLAACADRHASHYLEAVAALARGRVCLAAGIGDPRACLREALAGFSRAQLPMELARARLALADALVAERPEVAVAEARAALETFERAPGRPRRRRRRRGAAIARGPRRRCQAGWWAADQARVRGARAARPWAVQP